MLFHYHSGMHIVKLPKATKDGNEYYPKRSANVGELWNKM
jgi:hypothetical protein